MGHATEDDTRRVLRVILELGLGGSHKPLHGTARVPGSAGAHEFGSALDLLRIIELEAERATAAPAADPHHDGEPQ